MKETGIDLLQIHLMEPTTVITNLITGGLCLYFFKKLTQQPVQFSLGSNWKFFFFYMGIASIIGAFTHGFKSYFGNDDYYYIWLFMNLSGIPCSYFLLQANIELSKLTDNLKQILKKLSIVLTAALTLLVIGLNDFLLIKINAGFVILLTLYNHLKRYNEGHQGSGFILAGFLLSTLSIVVHTTQFSLSDWFNFKDISHVIMSISLYIIFLGVMLKMKVHELSIKKAT